MFQTVVLHQYEEIILEKSKNKFLLMCADVLAVAVSGSMLPVE